MDGAGFAFRGDHRIASVWMQANTDYSTLHQSDSNGLCPPEGTRVVASR